jgi:hypothetical protein
MQTDHSRRFLLISGGVVAVALAVGLGMMMGERRKSAAPPEAKTAQPEAKKVPVAANTPVKLILIDDLTSGGTPKDAPVRFALNTEIPGSDLPAIGTIVTGKVTWSRSEGTLGALTDSPARLNVALDPMGSYALSGSKEPADEVEFNRANTGLPGPTNAPTTSPEKVEILEKLLTDPSGSTISREAIESLKFDSALPATEKLLSQSRGQSAESLITALATGGTSAEFELALRAVNEVRGVLGRNLGALKRRLGGRNIHAYPGTEVTVYLTPVPSDR